MRHAAVLLVALLAFSACGPKNVRTYAQYDLAFAQAVAGLGEAEAMLSKEGVLTREQSIQINQALLPLSQLGVEATRALRDWKGGEAPEAWQKLTVHLGKLAQIIIDTKLVRNEDRKAYLLERLAMVQSAALTMFSLMEVWR